MKQARTALLLFAVLPALAVRSDAGVWSDVGDAQTRSDTEVAVAAGLLDNITTQGPQPWTSVLGQLYNEDQLAGMPDYVREAAARLLAKGAADLNLHRAHATLSVDATNAPAVVRGYDALGRSEAQGQLTYEYMATSTAVHIAVGAQKNSGSDRQALVFDGSYIAQRIDGVVVYAGLVPHWWGPGWISALTLSSNARPMPQIGFTRINARPSQSWLFSWLGPWQFEGFVGLLNGPRLDRNTGYVAMHFAFNPLPGLEIGLSRNTEICGSGHPCQPLTEYFTFSNNNQHANQTNDEASVELRYTNTFYSHAFALYAQFMNEDTNPIVHSSTSRLYGGSVWLPVEGLTGRLTLEYANSIATNDIWGGGAQHGVAYNNGGYPDGMRYRDRTLGFSLDSDSVLYSAQMSVVDSERRTLTLSYHRALVSNPLNTWGNVVSSSPVRFNMLEARLGVPFQWGEYWAQIETSVRWQDDQPRPDRGAEAAIEVALKLGI